MPIESSTQYLLHFVHIFFVIFLFLCPFLIVKPLNVVWIRFTRVFGIVLTLRLLDGAAMDLFVAIINCQGFYWHHIYIKTIWFMCVQEFPNFPISQLAFDSSTCMYLWLTCCFGKLIMLSRVDFTSDFNNVRSYCKTKLQYTVFCWY